MVAMVLGPHFWDAVTAIGTSTLALVAVIALVFTIVQVLNQKELGRIENLERQIAYLDSEEMIKHRKALARERLGSGRLKALKDDDAPSEMYRVLDFFEHLGFLVRKGHLRPYDVWHSFGAWVFPMYYDSRRVIEYEQSNDPGFYDDFVWLIGELKKVEEEKLGQKFEVPCDDDLCAYHEDELGGITRMPGKRKKKVAHSTGDAPSQPNSVMSETPSNGNN